MLKILLNTEIVDKVGKNYHILTAPRYSWSNPQIIIFDEFEYDGVKQNFHDHHQGWMAEYPSREDFIVFHAGGVKTHCS